MPKRSNDFQKLVRLIQQAFAPRGATVTESAILDHLGTPREIDVHITTDVGLYTMKIAVEVKDHSRPLGPGQIEEYIGKYRSGDGIPVVRVVVVSSAGFTRAGKDRARVANINLLTLKEARSADWAGFIPPDKPQSLTFQLPPHWHRPTFVPPLPESVKVEDVMQNGCITNPSTIYLTSAPGACLG